MNREKIRGFITKAIEKTKNQELSWGRLSGTLQSLVFLEANNLYNLFKTNGYNTTSSFQSQFGTGKIYLLLKENEISIAIQPSKDESRYSFLKIQEDDVELKSQVKRLYNIVYSLFPNVEGFIESFINDGKISSDIDSETSDDDLPI